jgi:hypothetical protein
MRKSKRIRKYLAAVVAPQPPPRSLRIYAFEASKYSDDLWISYTGKTLPQLNQQWRKAVAEEIAEAGRETVR